MQMLTLNQESMQLLRDSRLIVQFFKITLEPEKYFKYIRNRNRRDDFDGIDQLLQNLVNQDVALCN